jgi:hypothetical protein
MHPLSVYVQLWLRSFFSLPQIFKYTTYLGPTGHLQVYNSVYRLFRATTAASDPLDWRVPYLPVTSCMRAKCGWWLNFILTLSIWCYVFKWSNFLSCFGVRQSLMCSCFLCGERKFELKSALSSVKEFCYKPEGRGFETRWGELIFSIYIILPAPLGPEVYLASNRN